MPSYTEPILLVVVVAVLILFMVRNGRKRQRDAQQLTETLKPGAEIMTSSGIFGTIESIDEAENKIVLKTGPTSSLTIHRQAVGRVVTPPDAVDDTPAEPTGHVTTLNGEPVDDTSTPQYGERSKPRASGSDTTQP